jgi:hypothetical protein
MGSKWIGTKLNQQMHGLSVAIFCSSMRSYERVEVFKLFCPALLITYHVSKTGADKGKEERRLARKDWLV